MKKRAVFSDPSLRGTKQSHGCRETMQIRSVQFAIASFLAMTWWGKAFGCVSLNDALTALPPS